MSEGLGFSLTEEQQAFRAAVRDLVEDKIAPRAADIDAEDEYPWDIDELLVKNGLSGVSYPERYGGSGGAQWSSAYSSRRSPAGRQACRSFLP